MQQEHRELRRDVPDSEHAVLFIHGICSSPVFFTDFYAHVPEDWSIRSVLIEGHGATTKDIIEEYQGLTADDVQACLLFATKSLGDTSFMPLAVESN